MLMPIESSRHGGTVVGTVLPATFCLIVAVAPLQAQAQAHDSASATSGAYFKETHFAPRDTISESSYQGWKQFELNCSRCHGEYGVGTSFAPALVVSLKEGGTIPDEQAFIQTVCAGRQDKGMPSWCSLGLEIPKMQMIYSYLKQRADGKIGIGRPALRRDSTSSAGAKS